MERLWCFPPPCGAISKKLKGGLTGPLVANRQQPPSPFDYRANPLGSPCQVVEAYFLTSLKFSWNQSYMWHFLETILKSDPSMRCHLKRCRTCTLWHQNAVSPKSVQILVHVSFFSILFPSNGRCYLPLSTPSSFTLHSYPQSCNLSRFTFVFPIFTARHVPTASELWPADSVTLVPTMHPCLHMGECFRDLAITGIPCPWPPKPPRLCRLATLLVAVFDFVVFVSVAREQFSLGNMR
jgi:hypothetical protein